MVSLEGIVGACLAEKHMTKKAFAKELGYTPETLNNKLTGRTVLTVKDALKISEITGRSVDEICSVAP